MPVPTPQIHWVSDGGLPNRGAVRFLDKGDLGCVVQLTISYELPQILAPVGEGVKPVVEGILKAGEPAQPGQSAALLSRTPPGSLTRHSCASLSPNRFSAADLQRFAKLAIAKKEEAAARGGGGDDTARRDPSN